jgi:hypothetical protein
MLTRLSASKARFHEGHLERTDQAPVRILEGNLQLVMVVPATHWATLASKSSPKHLSKHISRKATWRLLRRAVWGSEPVKVFALLGIVQNFISLLDFFKLLCVTAFVGVVLASKPVIGFSNIRFLCIC